MRRTTLSLGFLLVTLGGALGSACGGDDSATGSTSATTGSTASASSSGQGGEGLGDFTSSVSSGSGGNGGEGGGEECAAVPGAGPFAWAAAYGDAADQSGVAIASDATGNVVIAGGFTGSMTFGATTLTSAGGGDVFVAKLDPTGAPIWAKSFGGAKEQSALGLAVDAAGNVVLTGQFVGTIGFGGATFTSAGCCFQDVFVAKLDALGNHVWSKQFGDVNGDTGRGVAVDGAGNVFVVGDFQTSIGFGGSSLTSAGGNDIFVAKLDLAGNHVWSKAFGDAADQFGRAVTAAMSDAVVTGDAAGSVDFGGGALPAAATRTAYVARLSGAAGAHVWSKAFGSGAAGGAGVAADPAGAIVVAGSFQGSIDLGGGVLDNPVNDDVFVVKLSGTGAHVWSRRFGDGLSQRALAVAAGASGEVAVAGNFGGTIDFGGGPLVNAGVFDAFVAKLDEAGCHVHSRAFGSPEYQSAEGVDLDASGNLVVTGSFSGSVDFGGGAVAASGSDVFAARLGP